MAAATPCEHADQIAVTEPGERVCQECVDEGLSWVALHLLHELRARRVLHLLAGRAREEAHLATGHPVIRSTERGWFWCYPDKRYVEP
jgi:hypothetical protein